MKKILFYSALFALASTNLYAAPVKPSQSATPTTQTTSTETSQENISIAGTGSFIQIFEIGNTKPNLTINVPNKKYLSSQIVSIKDSQGQKHTYQVFQYSKTAKPLNKNSAKKMVKHYQMQQDVLQATMQRENQIMNQETAQMNQALAQQQSFAMQDPIVLHEAQISNTNCAPQKHHKHTWWKYWLHLMFG
jgi:hypothetical protein